MTVNEIDVTGHDVIIRQICKHETAKQFDKASACWLRTLHFCNITSILHNLGIRRQHWGEKLSHLRATPTKTTHIGLKSHTSTQEIDRTDLWHRDDIWLDNI